MWKILVVENNKSDALELDDLLGNINRQVDFAMTAEEGLVLAQSRLPDVIFMDLHLPGLSGYQATRMLKQNPVIDHIPVILTSENHRETDVAWGMRQGAHAVLKKPLDPVQFRNIVHQLLNHPESPAGQALGL